MSRLVGILLLAGFASSGAAIPPICDPSCAPVSCSGPDADDCTACQTGAFLTANPGTCQPCTPINFCDGDLMCTAAGDSQCEHCSNGHYLQPGTPDQCPACDPIANCANGTVECTAAGDSTCGFCPPGTYNQG